MQTSPPDPWPVETPLKFNAMVRFLTKEEGGQTWPFVSGARMAISLPIGLCTAEVHSSDGKELLTQGENLKTVVTLGFVDRQHVPEVGVDYQFTLQGGSWVIGHGVITEML